MPKKHPITESDIRGIQSASVRALNPHIFGPSQPQPIVEKQAAGKPKKFRRSPTPKTRPEREMNAMLEARQRSGDIFAFSFEGITLEIGDGVRYTPDFTIWQHDGTLMFYEVKGARIWEDSAVKFKCAKAKFRKAKFALWQLSSEGWTRLDE